MLKIRSPDGKAICNNSGVEICNTSISNNDNNNNKSRKFRRKLIKSKIGNLALSKKIAKNNIMEIGPNFFISIFRKT